jgi:hypothetical protein
MQHARQGSIDSTFVEQVRFSIFCGNQNILSVPAGPAKRGHEIRELSATNADHNGPKTSVTAVLPIQWRFATHAAGWSKSRVSVFFGLDLGLGA